eukprot:14443582-Alexandrium_andersonii.AAC.1
MRLRGSIRKPPRALTCVSSLRKLSNSGGPDAASIIKACLEPGPRATQSRSERTCNHCVCVCAR